MRTVRGTSRSKKITYPGTGNYSQLTYDGLGRCVKIVEITGGSTTTKQFVWCDDERCEERDASGNVVKQFFKRGETVSAANYFYTLDHLGSVREMTNSVGAIVFQQSFDPYGQPTVSISTTSPDFGYAGYYVHQRSGLNLTVRRAYNAAFGRFVNRDPIAEAGGLNLYAYVQNDPVVFTDPSGLDDKSCKRPNPPTNGNANDPDRGGQPRNGNANNPERSGQPTNGMANNPDRSGQPTNGVANLFHSASKWLDQNWPPFLDPKNWPDPIDQMRERQQRLRDAGIPVQNWWDVKPPWWPGNTGNPNPQPIQTDPYVWPGSYPWNPRETAPYNTRV